MSSAPVSPHIADGVLVDELLERRREVADLEAELLRRLEVGYVGLTVATVARALGVERQTVYNRLARRQERRDQLGHTETPPASEAPADADNIENTYGKGQRPA